MAKRDYEYQVGCGVDASEWALLATRPGVSLPLGKDGTIVSVDSVSPRDEIPTEITAIHVESRTAVPVIAREPGVFKRLGMRVTGPQIEDGQLLVTATLPLPIVK